MLRYEVNIVKSVKGVIFITLIMVGLNFIVNKNKKENFNDNIINNFIKVISIFSILIFVVGLFIAFSY